MNSLKQKRAGLYVRCSTADQSTNAQESELREFAERRGWLVHRVYSDKGISGAKTQRPALDQLFADCHKRVIDAVLIWRYDRFARSLKELLRALEELQALGIEFISLKEGVDTSVPQGRLVFSIFGAIAEFERSLIAERVKAGIAQARREGKRIGRKPLRELSQTDIRTIIAAHAGGKSIRQTARDFQTTEFMVKKILSARHAA